MSRYELYKAVYGTDGFDRITKSKILIVGAGGIGCELLKNLALTGVLDIHLVDLDTIDVSNLNRQFLFRPEHVGQSKAVIAAAAAQKFNPDVTVTAYHDNIKGSRFSSAFFGEFDLVLNALDNLDARRHVNRLCLAAKVPLFDAGTTGYLGQVMPILKGFTACYECHPKPSPKVYPICTIRSTPDKPVHCIVWAKECFKLLFARASDSMLFEDASSGESSEYMHLINIPADRSVDSLLRYAESLLMGLFHHETAKKIAMDVYKAAQKVPTPLSQDVVTQALNNVRQTLSSQPATRPAGWEQRNPTVIDAVEEIIRTVVEVVGNDESVSMIGQLSFDKDDEWAMRFVAAASNIRSNIFSIPMLSFHDAKGIAGNIIPAIATTNAIVSGAQVALALKFLVHFTKDELSQEDAREGVLRKIRLHFPHAYCVRHANRKGYFLQPSVPDQPVESCYVCGVSQLTLQVDTTTMTLEGLVKKVLKGKLGVNEPSIGQGSNILYEEGDGADEDLADNLPLTLAQCPGGGIRDGSILEVNDFTQNLELSIVVRHVSEEELSKNEAAAVDLFLLDGSSPAATAAEEDEKESALAVAATRPESEEPPAKRSRTA